MANRRTRKTRSRPIRKALPGSSRRRGPAAAISEDDLDHVKSLLKKAGTRLKKSQKERKAEDEKLELPKLGEIKPPWVFRALLWWTRTSEGKKALPRIFKGYADHVLSARAEVLTRPDES